MRHGERRLDCPYKSHGLLLHFRNTTFEKAHLLAEFEEKKDRSVDLAMYRIWASNADLDTSFLGSFEVELVAKWQARLDEEEASREEAERAKEDAKKAKEDAPPS